MGRRWRSVAAKGGTPGRELGALVGRLPAKDGPPSADAVAAALPADVLFVDFVVFGHLKIQPAETKIPIEEGRIVAFLVRRGHPIACVPLGTLADLVVPLDQWTATMDRFDRGKETGVESTRKLREHAASMARQVWAPIAAHPHMQGIDRVVLAPDANLWRVPFAALPGQDADKYLIEETALSLHSPAGKSTTCFWARANTRRAPASAASSLGTSSTAKSRRKAI